MRFDSGSNQPKLRNFLSYSPYFNACARAPVWLVPLFAIIYYTFILMVGVSSPVALVKP